MKKFGVKIFVFGLLLLFSWSAIGMAADYPQRPIRVIIPWSAGGGIDILCRTFQPFFEKVLGQRILIENIAGGSTRLGTLELMKAKPDGYTVMFNNQEAWVGYYYSKSFDSKVWEQLVPICNIVSVPYGFIEVRAESPYKTWADLVKAAKENPGKLSCGGPSAGGMAEVFLDEISQASGIKVRYVPFAGGGPSKIALLGGHVDFRYCQPSEAIEMIRAGKTRGLAVSTDKRMKAIPDVPTFKELRIWGSLIYSRSFWGPPELPSNIVNTLDKIIEKASKDPAFIKIAQDKLLYTMDYRSAEKTKLDMLNFDKKFGPKLALAYK